MREIVIALISLVIGGSIGAFFMSLCKDSTIRELRARLQASEFWHDLYIDALQFISINDMRKLKKMRVG